VSDLIRPGGGLSPFGGGNNPLASQGAAKFMSAERALQFVDNDNSRAGLYFARCAGGFLKYSGDGHTMVVAPQGSGKGLGFVLPNLLSYPGSMVVIDPKGENAILTAEYRAKSKSEGGLGQKVVILDPAGVTGLPSDCYNPFDWLNESGENKFDADVRNMGEALVPGDGMESFWARGGSVAAAGLIYWLLSQKDTDCSLNGLYDIAFKSEGDWFDLWKRMRVARSGSPDLARRVQQLGNWFDGLHEDHKKYHRGTLQDGLNWLISNGARRLVASPSSFDMRKIKDEKITVYVCIPPDELSTYKTLARLVVTQALNAVFLRLARPGETPIVFMLDEFANSVGQMDIFDKAVTQIRGFGGRLAIVLQSIRQLKDCYRENRGTVSWETIEEACAAAVYFKVRGATAIHVSERLPMVDKPKIQPIGGPRHVQERLLKPHQVSDPPGPYGQESVFAFVEGMAPIWARTIKSNDDEIFRRLYNPNRFHTPTLPGGKSWRQQALENDLDDAAGGALGLPTRPAPPPHTKADENELRDLLNDVGWS
jgi:type IV secretion system protein VirD4